MNEIRKKAIRHIHRIATNYVNKEVINNVETEYIELDDVRLLIEDAFSVFNISEKLSDEDKQDIDDMKEGIETRISLRIIPTVGDKAIIRLLKYIDKLTGVSNE